MYEGIHQDGGITFPEDDIKETENCVMMSKVFLLLSYLMLTKFKICYQKFAFKYQYKSVVC